MKVFSFLLILVPSALLGQQALPDIVGSWQVDMLDGSQMIVVHSDSTVSFGEETVRIKISADTIYILFGDEWVGYNFELRGEALTLSGGDLEDPVVLTRINPALRGNLISRTRRVSNRGDEG